MLNTNFSVFMSYYLTLISSMIPITALVTFSSVERAMMIYLCCYTHTYTSISDLSPRQNRRCWSCGTNLAGLRNIEQHSLIIYAFSSIITRFLCGNSLKYISSLCYHPFFSRMAVVRGMPSITLTLTSCKVSSSS